MTILPQSREGVILHFRNLLQARVADLTLFTADPNFNPVDAMQSEMEFLTGILLLIERSL